MRTLKTATLILLILFGGHHKFAHSSVYPLVSDWDSPLAHGTSLIIYDVGTEIIKNGDTPVATITTVQQHEQGSMFN